MPDPDVGVEAVLDPEPVDQRDVAERQAGTVQPEHAEHEMHDDEGPPRARPDGASGRRGSHGCGPNAARHPSCFQRNGVTNRNRSPTGGRARQNGATASDLLPQRSSPWHASPRRPLIAAAGRRSRPRGRAHRLPARHRQPRHGRRFRLRHRRQAHHRHRRARLLPVGHRRRARVGRGLRGRHRLRGRRAARLRGRRRRLGPHHLRRGHRARPEGLRLQPAAVLDHRGARRGRRLQLAVLRDDAGGHHDRGVARSRSNVDRRPPGLC